MLELHEQLLKIIIYRIKNKCKVLLNSKPYLFSKELWMLCFQQCNLDTDNLIGLQKCCKGIWVMMLT